MPVFWGQFCFRLPILGFLAAASLTLAAEEEDVEWEAELEAVG